MVSSGNPFFMARVALCRQWLEVVNLKLKKSTRVGFAGIGGNSFLAAACPVCCSSSVAILNSSSSAIADRERDVWTAMTPRAVLTNDLRFMRFSRGLGFLAITMLPLYQGGQ